MARKDFLFYTEGLDVDQVIATVESLELKDEVLFFLKLVGFSGGKFMKNPTQTAYHKYLLKVPFYRATTIRNAKTFDKIGQMLKKYKRRHTMRHLYKIHEKLLLLKKKRIAAPQFGLKLGSGLGEKAEEISKTVV